MDSTSKRYKLKDNMDFNNKLLTDSLNPELNNLNKYEQNISNPDSLSNNNQHMFKIDTNIQKQLKDSIDNEYNKEIKQEQNYKFKK